MKTTHTDRPEPDRRKHDGRDLPRAPALVTGSLSASAGGVFYSARIPANRLYARGVALTAYGLRDAAWPEARDAWEVDEVIACTVKGPARFGFAPSMAREMLLRRHDLLHLRGLWMYPSRVVDLVRRRQAVPTIVSPEGMLDPWALAQSRLKKGIALALFERRNLHRATVLHALNGTELRDIRAFGLTNPVAVIPNGVDLPEVPVARLPPGLGERRRLLFLGRIHPKKGLAELIDAWAIAVARTPGLRESWQIDVAGWDDRNHLGELEARVARSGLDDSVAFVGPLHGAAKDRALRTASAFVLPSHGEGLPISVLEAWAYRLPVLMTRRCNIPEGFTSGAAREIGTDPAAMAATLAATLMADAAELRTMGDAGHRLVDERFRWDTIVDDYAELYRWAAAGGAAGGRTGSMGGGTAPAFVET